MTDAKVLADALVEAGIVYADEVGNSGYQIPGDCYRYVPAKYLVTDWRVAGKVLESMRQAGLHVIIEKGGIIVPLGITPNGETVSTGAVIDESLPRAIVEAWHAGEGGKIC